MSESGAAEPGMMNWRRLIPTIAIAVGIILVILLLSEDIRNWVFSPLQPLLNWTRDQNNAGAVQAASAILQVIATVILLGLTWHATETSRQIATQAQKQADVVAQRVEQRQRENTRLLVSAEIDHNLALFQDYWSRLNSSEAEEESPAAKAKADAKEIRPEREAQYWAQRLVDLPLPHWVHRSWNALVPSLPVALSPDEIEKVNRLNTRLDALSIERAELVGPASEEPRQETQYDVWGKPDNWTVYPQRFNNMAPAAWMRCEAIAQEILETGNPLKPPAVEHAQ